MLFREHIILIRGGGDLATGVAYRLHHAGFPVIVTELPNPLVVRRRVALAAAVLDGEAVVESLRAVRAKTPSGAWALAQTGDIPVLVTPGIPLEWSNADGSAADSRPSVVIDARMAKRNIDTTIEQAPLVIGMGPGFTAGVDCHAVIETNRGHRLGRVIWDGAAEANTGTPGLIAGKGRERVLRAPAAGAVAWRRDIGHQVTEGEVLGEITGEAAGETANTIVAPFDGVVRGLIAPGTVVPEGLKIGDVDPRGDVDACYTISEKALAIGGGVLEAVLIHLNRSEE